MSKNKHNKRNLKPSQPIRHAPPPMPPLAPENGVSGHPESNSELTLSNDGLRMLQIARDQLAEQLRGLVEQIEKIKRDAEAEIGRLTQQARQLERAIDQQDGGIQTMQLLLSGLPENRVEIDRTPLPNGPSIPAGMMPPPNGAVPMPNGNGNGGHYEGPEDRGEIGF